MVPMTKKEFIIRITAVVILLAALLGVVLAHIFINEKSRISPELQVQIDRYTKLGESTKAKVSENLWNTAGNEALLIANTVEENTSFDLYVLYRAEDNSYECQLIADDINSAPSSDERRLIQIKYQNALASSKVFGRISNPEIIGIIINWRNDSGEKYSLIEVNGDGSWDYIAKDTEAHFKTDETGKLAYTSEEGEEVYVSMGEDAKEIIGSHLLLSEAEKVFD